MIRVLAVSHAYVEPFTRVGLLDPATYPDVETTILLPENAVQRSYAGYEKLNNEFPDIRPLKTIFNFHHSVRVYGRGLVKAIVDVKPDIIMINNEAWSVTALQTVLCAKMLRSDAKIAVYTSENQLRKCPLPFAWFERFVLRHADAVMYVAQYEGKAVLQQKGYSGKTYYLPLSVDADHFSRHQDAGELKKKYLGGGKYLVGYVGRLVEEKGIDVLVRAIKQLGSDFRLFVIGTGSYAEEATRLTMREGISDRVTFADAVNNDDLPRYLSCLDALVLPSRTTKNWKEQFGRILVEAMACGTPVIGSSSGEIPNVIGEAGLVFPEGDIAELARQIRKLASDEKLRMELGAKGVARVRERFDRKVVNRLTYDIYREMTREGSR